MDFPDLTGATVLEADGAGIRLRLPDGREAEIFPTTDDLGAAVLFTYETS